MDKIVNQRIEVQKRIGRVEVNRNGANQIKLQRKEEREILVDQRTDLKTKIVYQTKEDLKKDQQIGIKGIKNFEQNHGDQEKEKEVKIKNKVDWILII